MNGDGIERLFFYEDHIAWNTHFEIGKHLHLETYYNAKKYFQDLGQSRHVASRLKKKINEVFPALTDVTFIGCGTYMSRCLDRTVKLLKKDQPADQQNFNYGIIDNSEKNLRFYLLPEEIHKRVIIVLPITCTFSNITNIQNLLNTYSKDFRNKIHHKFLSVFLVLDRRIRNMRDEGLIDSIENDELKLLYSSFNWKSLQEEKVIFTTRHSSGDQYEGHFLNVLVSRFLLPERCSYCFPQNTEEEKSLYPTRRNNDTPDVIFSLPDFYNNTGRLATDRFEQIRFDQPFTAHLYGNLRIGESSFLHYIKKDGFYENNKDAILRFFREVFQSDGGNDPKGRILILTPSHHHSSRFLEDLLELDAFAGNDIVVIPVKPAVEFLENFVAEYKEELPFSVVLYFDYSISTGTTFTRISEYVEFARGGKGIDYIITLIDRTTGQSKQRILERLNSSDRVRPFGKEQFIGFFRLNVPAVDSKNIGNPLEERNAIFESLLAECHLDALKMAVGREILKGRFVSLKELDDAYSKEPLATRKENLLLLHLSHEISRWISEFAARHKDDAQKTFAFNLESLQNLLTDLTNSFRRYKDFDRYGDEDTTRLPVREWAQEEYISKLAIKLLSRPPYKYYQPIYQAVFEYTNARLSALVDALYKFEMAIPFDHLRLLEFYTERSVELNSNFILSFRFLDTLRYLYEDRKLKAIYTSKYFLLMCYKRLIFDNPVRSIFLEEQLNKDELSPQPIKKPNISLKEALQDEFYQLRRLLKAENIHVLNGLKKDFLTSSAKTRFEQRSANVFEQYVREKFISDHAADDPTLRYAQNFLRRSRHAGFDGGVLSAVSSMLQTVYLLNREKDPKRKFLTEVREILTSLCSIIDDGLEYGFFIEFMTGNKDEMEAKNIFSVLSDDSATHISEQKIDKDGMIFNMLYGLRDANVSGGNVGVSDGHIQTFIGIAKDGNGVFSFRDEYVGAQGKRVPVANIVKDQRNHDTGFNVIGRAKMILLFRLATIDPDAANTGSGPSGQAVLCICYPQELYDKKRQLQPELTDTKALTDFVNIERVRLLLLIKEDFLNYLKRIVESDTFIELMEERKEMQFRRSMEHGLKGYFHAMAHLLAQRNVSEEARIALNFIRNVLYSHIRSSNPDSPMYVKNLKPYEKSSADLKKLFATFMDTEGLADNIVSENDRELEIDTNMTFKCVPVIYEQIIPELLINMRKYSYDCEGKKFYSIWLKDNFLYFRNPYDKSFLVKPEAIKPGGGKEMSNHILLKLGLPPLEALPSDDAYFTIGLPLK